MSVPPVRELAYPSDVGPMTMFPTELLFQEAWWGLQNIILIRCTCLVSSFCSWKLRHRDDMASQGMVDWPWLDTKCPPKPLSHSPPQLGRGEKIQHKARGSRWGQGDPVGCSASGTGCSSMGPPRGHKPCQQTCCSMGSSLHRATGPARSLLYHGLPTGSQHPSGIHLLWCGVLHRPWGHSLPHHGLHHGLQGNLFSSTWSTSSPPSSPTLLSAGGWQPRQEEMSLSILSARPVA